MQVSQEVLHSEKLLTLSFASVPGPESPVLGSCPGGHHSRIEVGVL